jgi:hypothetical protein
MNKQHEIHFENKEEYIIIQGSYSNLLNANQFLVVFRAFRVWAFLRSCSALIRCRACDLSVPQALNRSFLGVYFWVKGC